MLLLKGREIKSKLYGKGHVSFSSVRAEKVPIIQFKDSGRAERELKCEQEEAGI